MDDPRFIELRRTLEPRAMIPGYRDHLTREAAVALVIRPRDELELLLIKRATHEADPWSGHMALPGGRRESNDATLRDTAIRETAEEVGIALHADNYIGALDELAPRIKRLPPILIAPFVFGVPSITDATVAAAEVDAAIWVPISALRDESAASEILIELEGGSHSYPSLQYGEYVIWGLTHRILTQFLELAQGL